MGGVQEEALLRDCVALGARLILAGNDHGLLLGAATARARLVAGLA
jgi:2-keto-3-deoxy-L-rhamnonate aldolase RhmA